MRSKPSRAALAAIFLLAPGVAWAESKEVVNLAAVGRDYYEQYCQVCHGDGGKGDGPYANVLSVPPADLTRIAKRHGSFTEVSIAELIDGRRSPRAHGDPEMPIWGRSFRSELRAGPGRDTVVRAKVSMLIEYLRSIQEDAIPEQVATRDAPEERTVADVGWHLYLQRCASCHGFEGRGDGYLAPLLVHPPPNLTTIAARRGSKFPSLVVAGWIDGRRGRGAHGPREMPVWGERFGELLPPSQGREAVIRGEIQLLVAFLRSIQEPDGSAGQN